MNITSAKQFFESKLQQKTPSSTSPLPPPIKFQSTRSFALLSPELQPAISQINSVLVDDILQLPTISPTAVVELLRNRFAKDSLYTHLGRLVLAVNPYKRVDALYSDATTLEYIKRASSPAKYLAPHLFTVGNDALENVRKHGVDQIISISGESGSGKTESARLLISYIVNRNNSSDNKLRRVCQQIMDGLGLMESFGNASTSLNFNSSRHGRLIDLAFDQTQGSLVAVQVSDYLLERSRVVFHSKSERNYHIFYEFIGGMSDDQRRNYSLDTLITCDYFSTGIPQPTSDFKEAFAKINTSLVALGFNMEELKALWSMLACVCHLGTIKFERLVSDTGVVGGLHLSSLKPVQTIAGLMKISDKTLASLLTVKTTEVGSERLCIPLTPDQAFVVRDAIAKFIYVKLFSWLSNKVNESLAVSLASNAKLDDSTKANICHIGILDIFGFEDFTSHNSLEQLCINFASESLHAYFLKEVIKMEQESYIRDGLKWTKIEMSDNTNCIDLLVNKNIGIMTILDDHCFMPNATDVSFLNKCNQLNNSSPSYCRAKNSEEFGIAHYAGKVWYQTQGFLEKNRDSNRPDIIDMLVKSQNPIVASIFSATTKSIAPASPTISPPSSPTISTPSSPPRRTRCFTTISSMYQESLSQLIAIVNRCQPHFVRCIRSNRNKKSDFFDADCVLDQLRCGGIIDAARVRKAGYPARVKHAEFVASYAPLLVSLEAVEALAAPDACRHVLTAIGAFEMRDFQIGRTTVFLTDSMFRRLEAEVQAKRWAAISKWQKAVFRYIDDQRGTRLAEEKKKREAEALAARNKAKEQITPKTETPSAKQFDSALAAPTPIVQPPATPSRDFLQEVITYLQSWQLVDDDRHVAPPASLHSILSSVVPYDPIVLKTVVGAFMQTTFPSQRKSSNDTPNQQDVTYISRIVSMFVNEKSLTGLQQLILATLAIVSCQVDGVEAVLNNFHNSVFSLSSSSNLSSPNSSRRLTYDFVVNEIIRSLTTATHSAESKTLLWVLLLHVVSSYDVPVSQAKTILTTIAADQQQSPSITAPHLVLFVYQKMFPLIKQLVRYPYSTTRILAPTLLEWITNIRLNRMALNVKFVDGSVTTVEVTSHTSVEEFSSLCVRTKYLVSPDISPQLLYTGWSTVLVFAGIERVELWPEAKLLDLISHIEMPQELQPRGRFPGLGLIQSLPAVISSGSSPKQTNKQASGSLLTGFFVQATNPLSPNPVRLDEKSSMISGPGPRQTSTPKNVIPFRQDKHVSFDDDQAAESDNKLVRQPSISSTTSNLARIDDYINKLFDFGITTSTTALQTSTAPATATLVPPAPTLTVATTAASKPAAIVTTATVVSTPTVTSSASSTTIVSASGASAIVDTRSLYAHMNNSAVAMHGMDVSMNGGNQQGGTNVKQAARVLDRFLKPDMINLQQLPSQNVLSQLARNSLKNAFVNEGNSLSKLVTLLDDQLAVPYVSPQDGSTDAAFITYANPQWQLTLFKAFLTPAEAKTLLDADRGFLRLILAQIIDDAQSSRPGMFSRLSSAEHTSLLNMAYTRRLTKSSILAAENFMSSSSGNSSSTGLDVDFMKLIVKMAIDMKLYFAIIYPISGVIDESGVSTIITDIALAPRYLSMLSRRIDPTTSSRILDTVKSFLWSDVQDVVIAGESTVKITVSGYGDYVFSVENVDMLADRLSAFTIESQSTIQFIASSESVPSEPGDHQLTLRKGDVIYVLDAQPQDGLLYGSCRGRCGFFPIAAVTPADLSALPLELRRHFADKRIQDCDLIVDAGTLTAENLVSVEGWLLRGDDSDRPADKGDNIANLVNRLALRRQREMIEQQALGGNGADAFDNVFPSDVILLNVNEEMRPMCAQCGSLVGRFIRLDDSDVSVQRELLSGILANGMQYPLITDEIFLQTVKSLVIESYPSPAFVHKTLFLLTVVAKFFRCSDTLRPYVFLFLAEQLATGKNRELILECAASMTKLGIMGSRRCPPSPEEVDYCYSLREGRRNPNTSVFVRVFLPGQRRVAVYVDSCSLVREVVDTVMAALGVEIPYGRVGVGSSSMKLSLTESYEYRLYYRRSPKEAFILVSGASYILDLYKNASKTDSSPQHLDLVIRRLSWLYPVRSVLSAKSEERSTPVHPFLVDMLSFQILRSWLEANWSPLNAESPDELGRFVSLIASLQHRASIPATDDRPPSASELSSLMPRWVYQLRPDWLRSVQQTYFDSAAKLSPQAARRQLLTLLVKECPLGAASFLVLLGAYLPTSALRGAALLGFNAKGIVVLHPESRVPMFFCGYEHILSMAVENNVAATGASPGSISIVVKMSPVVLLPPESRYDGIPMNAQQAPALLRFLSLPSENLLTVLQHHVDLFAALKEES